MPSREHTYCSSLPLQDETTFYSNNTPDLFRPDLDMDASWLSCPSYPGYDSTLDSSCCPTGQHAHPVYLSPTDCAPYDDLSSHCPSDLAGLGGQAYVGSAYASSLEAAGSIRTTSSPVSFLAASTTCSPAVTAQQPHYGGVHEAPSDLVYCLPPQATVGPRTRSHWQSKLQQVGGPPSAAKAQQPVHALHSHSHNDHPVQAQGPEHPSWHPAPPSGWCSLPVQTPYLITDQHYQHYGPVYSTRPVSTVDTAGQLPSPETQGRVWEISDDIESNTSVFPAAATSP